MSTATDRPAFHVGQPLTHPGPAPAERIVSVPTLVDVVRTSLPPGAVLTEAIGAVLDEAGGAAASAEISGGTLGTVPYVYPALAAEGEERAVAFTSPFTSVGPCLLLGGSVTVGHRDGARYTHTHATWIEAVGTTRGGHLLPEATVGDVPVDLVLRVLRDARFISTDDPETRMPAFTPSPHPAEHVADAAGDAPSDGAAGDRIGNGNGGDASSTVRQAVVSRVRPGVDLHEAVRRICGEAGFRRARVHSSLGSTVGASMVVGTAGDGTRPHLVDPPAVEFTRLVGKVEPAADATAGEPPAVRLVGTCVDIHGEVHNGALVESENTVAVTFELFVEEVT